MTMRQEWATHLTSRKRPLIYLCILDNVLGILQRRTCISNEHNLPVYHTLFLLTHSYNDISQVKNVDLRQH